ncbi:MAG: DNA-directed RNA polymerase subunit alpha [Candidatus Caldatribacteriaceae bacterium]
MQDLKSLMKCELLEFKEDPATWAQYGKFSIEPFESGWGVTVGNALRRVLLSSIEGSAVTAVQIDGVIHEFSPLPGIREDVTDVILNLKGLVLQSYSDNETLYLDVKGVPGALRRVTARDIRPNPNVEIINPDHYLAELEEDGHLSMRIFVGRGKGYREAEEDTYHSYDVIPVDAIFTPVRKVNFQVVDTRVGQFTNYDKVLLEIWTNGAITPQQAFRRALELLVEEFSHLLNLLREHIGEPVARRVGEEAVPKEEREMNVEELELSVRAYNCLKRAHINTVRELLEIVQNRPEDLKKIKNLGQKTYEEILGKLEKLGYRLGEKKDTGSDQE